MSVYLLFFLFQSSGEGPKRIPMSQQSHLAVVTPTPRVLGVSNGPQRIQRPVSHQKSLTDVCYTVKSTHSNQNVDPQSKKSNPALQSKHGSQQIPTKINVPNVAQPTAKQPEPDKMQSKSSSVFYYLLFCSDNVIVFIFPPRQRNLQKTSLKRPLHQSMSVFIFCFFFPPNDCSTHRYSLLIVWFGYPEVVGTWKILTLAGPLERVNLATFIWLGNGKVGSSWPSRCSSRNSWRRPVLSTS